MDPLTTILLAAAVSGYGDAPDGYPSWAERELHLYTNAARVDPAAFEDEYNAGGCSFYEDFSADEKTPKAPVYHSLDLNDAARFHSEDMQTSGIFSHSSSDGTSFQARVARFYPDSGTIGENIAYNYPDNWAVVFNGWMCSTSGHRANIMDGGWNELGTGVAAKYYTQDFGAGAADSALSIRMGVHTPQSVSHGQSATFYADYEGSGLASIALVLDGTAHEMALEWGEADQGVYRVDAALPDEGGCFGYHFAYSDGAGEGTFPETGSYQLGPDCEADWIEGQEAGGAGWWVWHPDGTEDPAAGIDDGEFGEYSIGRSGCASAAPRPGWLLAGLALAGLGLRRRR